mmetsp:Transcript_5410/g.8376  ORF Transcript_5410/g.8376 Transcript_5410/m.8376 type:complete len:402 (-) Transcript_5410:1035-2240(-)
MDRAIVVGGGCFLCGFLLGKLAERNGKNVRVPPACGLFDKRNSWVDLRRKSQLEGSKACFVNVFHDIKAELVEDLEIYGLLGDCGSSLQKMLEYNVPGGKLNRGLSVMHTVLKISQSRGVDLSEETMRKSAVLGWCIEWIQSSFLVADDIMDSSITRRGHPCWYKREEIGLIAVNDALVLLTLVEVLLHKYFGDDASMFMRIHALLTETIYQTELGQSLDLMTQPPNAPVNLENYTEERYNKIVEYKTAYYSFYAPIALGMICAGVSDAKSFQAARSICVRLGTYFQVQDDFLDCYGSPEVIGKIGTDIQDNKCSWLIVQALKRASSTQREIIKVNYGIDNPSNISKIKQVYSDLNLPEIYKEYEETLHFELIKEIDQQVLGLGLGDVFKCLLGKIYKRRK